MRFGERLHSVPSATAAEAAARAGGDPGVADRIELVLSRWLREARLIVDRRREDVERVGRLLADRSTIRLSPDGRITDNVGAHRSGAER